ncbi:CLIP domain-containing serine protease HP8 isoform X2 [Anabrus simplex]|uniref:CLIP domain-containing serine protease HP8 isoform X2 n=1 Tax=Anabrus simplex TaxID=316456 RepID=UPI0035A36A7E
MTTMNILVILLVGVWRTLAPAHCFWNDGRAVELNDYRMTVGNLLREYDHSPNDTKEMIRDLFFHERYRGSELNFAHDIVIVRLMKRVKFSPTVEPVAIDWRSSFKDEDLMGQSGTVVGWGYTEFDQPSYTRIAVNLPYIDFDTCWKTVPRAFRSYITPDKFCAGLRNGTTVCPGDSGGGLVFADIVEKKWYIRGIVSVGVQPDAKSKCRKAQFSAFTSISSYRTWLREKFVLIGESLSNPLTQTEKTIDPDVIVFPSD